MRGGTVPPRGQQRKENMKKLILIMLVLAPVLAACAGKCESEPIVEENHKLIVPPNFGQMPK